MSRSARPARSRRRRCESPTALRPQRSTPRPRLAAPPPTLLGGLGGLGGSASAASSPSAGSAGTLANATLLTVELGDGESDRLRYGEVQSRQQSEGSQQLDHRCHLHRLAPLGSLHGRLTDSGLPSHLGLSPVALEAVTLQPLAKLSKNGCVSGSFV